MTASSSSQWPSSPRDERILRVVCQVLHERFAGTKVSHEQVLAQHADLLPDLADELKKLDKIGNAIECVDYEQGRRALLRLDLDWTEDRATEQRGAASAELGQAADAGPHRTDLSTQGVEQSGTGTSDNRACIGRYRVEGLLGEGGYGSVYRAWDDQLARHVAVKVPHRQTDSMDVEAYLLEARVLAGLDHAAIVPVYDAGRTDDGRCFLVSKLIRGKDLAARLRPSPVLQSDVARIVLRVAGALHYAHECGVVHRDIKPANILLDAQGKPYVTDFGLALQDTRPSDECSRAGTPAYMSPEQARGEAHRVDGRSDIFSLGVVFYELLTGRKPFTGQGYEELLEQVLWVEPCPPSELRGNVADELERICLKSLSKRAADRYTTAQDLADDLQHFLEPASSSQTAAVTDVAMGAACSGPIAPKGLRPFDANDAETFLELLPGPRDRTGLPESIRQWKIRVEQRNRDETFAVGLLYGPSGCGKSSFVRAGLLPRLAKHVRGVYLEATTEDTEEHLLRRLGKLCPELPTHASLASSLAEVRRGHGLPAGQKLLFVIDQFEQWLHGRGEGARRSLVEALRQCDGERVQCLLLVRDDFWLALSRFLSEVEVDLVQGRNTELVDLFDPQHARAVLARFGRACAKLPDDPARLSAAQSTFLERAVAGLCQDEKVIPVRLALFVEMVKNRPWTPGTLREFGGAAGVGVTYLEETFSARSANPQSRVHQRAARAVLEALLPEPGKEIKGHIRSYPELLDISGYGNRPRAFRELMRILDSETRLLTPTDPLAEAAGAESVSLAGRYYQLTHDYLVPSLREWLTTKQRKTPAGRTELRLAERATMWSARPERRQLPSLWEWVAIRCLTRASLWTSAQRKMMRAAGRRHALTWGLLCLLSLVFLLVGTEVTALAKSALLQFRARTAIVWLAFGQDKAIWPLLKHEQDPSLRTSLMHRISPLVVDPQQLVEQLSERSDVSVRRAVLLVIGQIVGDPHKRATSITLRNTDPQQEHIRQLIELYRDDPDPGIHAAVEWTLRRYGKDVELDRVDHRRVVSGSRGDRQWIVTRHGHTMVIIRGLTQYSMGSPRSERQRDDDEPLHDRHIHGNYSIASKETSVEQFERFVRDHPDMRSAAHYQLGTSPELPQSGVSWYQAAAYCNWLSQKEGIEPSQWCYEPNLEGKYAAGMKIRSDTALAGYRLPTEAEWEYACRAGAITARYFGRTDAYLDRYAVFAGVTDQDLPLPVGRRKPNDFGLFDMLGNLSEWCQDRYYTDTTSVPSGTALDRIADDTARVLRGGSYRDDASHLRCAARTGMQAESEDLTAGFRVARSYR